MTRTNARAAGSAKSSQTVTVPATGTALLLIDVINDLAFEDSDPLVEQAETMAPRLATLKRRAARAGIPSIYVNDNFGKWRSDFRTLLEHVLEDDVRGKPIAELLKPDEQDYFVLKPKHSGFYDTTLDTLLESLAIRRLILTGIAGNICVLFTANDAYMREFKVFAPADCIVSNTSTDNDHALKQIRTVLKGSVAPSHQLLFRHSGRGHARRTPRATGRATAGVT